MAMSGDVGGMIKLNVHHNWRVHKCVGINVSVYKWESRDFGYTRQIITHEVIRRKWSRDGNCRVTHVKSVMHKMTHLCVHSCRIDTYSYLNITRININSYLCAVI